MVHYCMSRTELYKKKKDNIWTSTAIVLNSVRGDSIEVKKGIGKTVDSFNFTILNPSNELFNPLYDGDGSTTAFTLPYSVPSDVVAEISEDSELFEVYVGSSQYTFTTGTPSGTQFGISGSTLTLGTAPAAGTRNIDVRFDILSADDIIRLFIWKDKATQSNADMLIEGIIMEPMSDSSDSGNFVTVRGKGVMEIVLAGLTFNKTEGTLKTYQIIQQLLADINNYNPIKPKRTIYGAESTEWTTLGNPIVKMDGTAFPEKNFSTDYKSAIELIEQLSSDEFTEDGQYIFWVEYNPTDDQYEFFWRPKVSNLISTKLNGGINNSVTTITVDDTSDWNGTRGTIKIDDEEISFTNKTDTTFTGCVRGENGTTAATHSDNTAVRGFTSITQGTTSGSVVPILTKANRKVDDVVNFVIYNVGPGCDEISMIYIAEDLASVSSYGGRWHYTTKTSNIAPDLIKGEFSAHPTYFDTTPEGKPTSNYPMLSGGTWSSGATWTFQFNGRNQDGDDAGSLVTCGNTQAAYNDVIDKESEYRGLEIAIDLIRLYSNPRIEAECELQFHSGFALGDLVELTFKDFGQFNKRLRTTDITYNLDKTSLTLEEDEGTIET